MSSSIRSVNDIARPPYSVQFEITFRCNLRCNMCYNGSGPARPGELKAEDWLDVAKQAIDMGIMEAIVSGGEPLLKGPKLVQKLLGMFTDAGVSIHLITNGTYVTEQFVRSLRGMNMRICQTSIDGPNAEIHNAIRGQDNFDDVTNATNLFSSYGFNSRIGTTVQRMNQDRIQEMIELAVVLGAHEVVMDEFLPIGRSISNYEAIRPSRPRQEIREEIRYYQDIYQTMILVREGMSCDEQLRQQAAPDVNDSIIIRPDGEMRLGCMAPFTVGNVRAGGLAKVWREAGSTGWKSTKVQSYVEQVRDNSTLLDQHKRLGALNGYENATI